MRNLPTPVRATPQTWSRIHLSRIKALGPGSRATRRSIEAACPSTSAANQWIDLMTKRGVLVPCGWGEFHMVTGRVLAAISWLESRHYQRLVSWALTLPKTLHSDVSFLGPRVWQESELAIWHPIPVVPLPVSSEAAHPPPQLGAVEYSPHRIERWSIRLPGNTTVPVPVVSRLDACILLGSNADPRWKEASKRMFEDLSLPEKRRVTTDLRRIRRYNGVAYRTRDQVQGSDPVLRLPGWWRQIHEDAVSFLVGTAYGA